MTGVYEPPNPEMCVCGHHKFEHGGRLTKYVKKLGVGEEFVKDLVHKRLVEEDFPKLKKFYACVYSKCSCEKFKGLS